MSGRFLFLTCILSLQIAYGQDVRLKMFSTSDGLSNHIIRNITQDQAGHLWVGTENGLNRFDGYTFQSFTNSGNESNSISNNTIFGLAVDHDGIIWIGTDFGLNAYDPSINKFVSFLKGGSGTISNNHIRAIFVDGDNNVWVGTEDGLNLFLRNDSTFKILNDPRKFEDDFGKKNLSFNRINAINEDTSGNIWVGSDGGGVKVYEVGSDQFLVLNLPPARNSHLFNIIRTIYQDNHGLIWFGCDGGLVSYDPSKSEFKSFHPGDHPDSLGSNFVWSLLEDQDDHLWAGTYGGGLFVYDRALKKFSPNKLLTNRTTSYDDNLIWPMFKDDIGNIWVGFDGNGGLGVYHPSAFKFEHLLPERDGVKNNVHHIIELTPDSLLVDTSLGRFILTDNSKKIYLNHINAGFSPETKSIKIEGGYLFTGNRKLVQTNSNFVIQEIIEEDSIGMVTAYAFGTGETLWLGTLSNGLIHLNLQTKEMRRYFTEGHLNVYHDSRSISSLYLESDSILWVGAIRYGLTRMNTLTGKKTQYLINTPDYAHPTINTIVKGPNDNLWLGTIENGLIEFDITSGRTQSHFSGDQIKQIIPKNKESLWISSSNGVIWYNHHTDSSARFGTDDGLQGIIFNKASHVGKSGLIYFGGENGINSFNPENIYLTRDVKTPIIEEITINHTSVQWTMQNPINSIRQIDINHNENNINFVFSANDLVHARDYQFEYAINGTEWSQLQDSRNLNLSNLAADSYQILIRSINHDGARSDIKELEVIVHPPWYLTWWAGLFYFFTLVLSIGGFYQRRIRSIRQQKEVLKLEVYERTKALELSQKQAVKDKVRIEKVLEERESLLKEIHHRVKNNLQVIASLLHLQSGKFENEDIKKVLEEGEGRVRSMALIHQKLYENEDIKHIPLSDYLQELIAEIKNSFGDSAEHIEIHISASDFKFDIDTAIPLGLIVNELITNSFKYAFGEVSQPQLSIVLTKEEGTFTLIVKDNGTGIPKEIEVNKPKTLGLRLVKALSEQLFGEYEFQTSKGTEFKLKFAV